MDVDSAEMSAPKVVSRGWAYFEISALLQSSGLGLQDLAPHP